MWASLAPLRSAQPEVRWLRPELLHLTLVFLGQTNSAAVPRIEAALESVARRHSRYAAVTAAAGGRIDDRPTARRGGVAWLTLAEGAAQTAALALDLDTELDSRTFDARRRPRPHLTVARNVDAAALRALQDLAPSLKLEWTVAEIALFRSHTSASGSRYEPLRTCELQWRLD